jgi:LEA14-like dessication related protein
MRNRHLSRYIVAAIAVSAGLQCASLAKKIFDPPQIGVDRVEIRNIALTGAELVVHVKINNPNSVGATLNRLEYTLDVDGERLVRGQKEDKTTIAANALSIVALPLSVSYAGMRSGIAGALTKKALPFSFTGKIVLDSPVGDLSFDIAEKGEIPVPDRPRFEITKIALAELGVTSATLMLHIRVTNNHDFELDIRRFRYEFSLQDNLVSTSEVTVERLVGQDKSMAVVLPVTLKLLGLKKGVVDMLRSGQLRYAMKFHLDLNTRFGPVTVPYEKDGLTSLY